LIEAATGSPIYVTSLPVEFQDLGSSQPASQPQTVEPLTDAISAAPLLPTSYRRDSETTVPSPDLVQARKSSPTVRRLSIDAITTSRSPVLNGHKRLPIGTALKGELVKSDHEGRPNVFLNSENGQVNGQASGSNSIAPKPRKSPKPQIGEDLM